MKICNKCLIPKDHNEFGKCKTCKDNLRPSCKSCYNKMRTEEFRTKEGMIKMAFKSQKRNSKIRGHRAPEYNLKELTEWCFSQKLFHELYDEWKQSKFDKNLHPSIDRKYDEIHYCFQNIELMTWKENFEKSVKDKTGRKSQIHNLRNK